MVRSRYHAELELIIVTVGLEQADRFIVAIWVLFAFLMTEKATANAGLHASDIIFLPKAYAIAWTTGVGVDP